MTERQIHKVALAAGGTGGHIFPAQALAGALLGRGIEVMLLTDRRVGGFGQDLPNIETHIVASGGIAGIGIANRIRNLGRLAKGYLQARAILKKSGANCVVGFGGYPSVPPIMAGAHLGLRIILHEQNAVLGRANRALVNRAGVLCTSFDAVSLVSAGQSAKVRLTGNPVRPAIAEIGRRPYRPAGPGERFSLLVTGGSQGAQAFNDLVPKAVTSLPEDLRQNLVVHQQVPGDVQEVVRRAYEASGVEARVAPFFTDLPERLAEAQLVICRAGASTVSELGMAGRPAILVPLPSSIDDHQRGNAMSLSEVGGGWLMQQNTLTAESLAGQLQTLLTNPAQLAEAAHAALKTAKRDAAEHLADAVLGIEGSNGENDLAREVAA